MIRLLPKTECGKDKDGVPFLNVFKSSSKYENIQAYFFRSELGIAVIISDALTAEKQARAIMKIKRGIQRCKTAEMGLVDGNGVYHCGGSLCCGRDRKQISEGE
jgi:hypothetical protein